MSSAITDKADIDAEVLGWMQTSSRMLRSDLVNVAASVVIGTDTLIALAEQVRFAH